MKKIFIEEISAQIRLQQTGSAKSARKNKILLICVYPRHQREKNK